MAAMNSLSLCGTEAYKAGHACGTDFSRIRRA
jgi:hypothetical protein